MSGGVRLDCASGCGDPQRDHFPPWAAKICNESFPSLSQRRGLHPRQPGPGSAASQNEHHVHLLAPTETVGCSDKGRQRAIRMEKRKKTASEVEIR